MLVRAVETAVSDVVDADTFNFACALARQCFINEYVFDESEHERERAGALRDRLVTALQSDGPIHALWLATVASYIPLHSLPGADGLAHEAGPRWQPACSSSKCRSPRRSSAYGRRSLS